VQLVRELGRDLIAAAAKRDLVFLATIVGVIARDTANRGLRLHDDIVLEFLDIEDGPRRVPDAPDDDGRDFDRIAALVIDLEETSTALAAGESLDCDEARPRVRE
jgi:hypothetical protein